MRTLMRRSPLHYIIGSFALVALTVSLASWQHISAEGPESADEKLANEVELNVPKQLRIAGKHAYSVKIKLTSKIDEPVDGPIYLVVEGTGIESLIASQPDGLTEGDEPYYLLLPPSKKLVPARPFVTQKLSFGSDSALRSSQRREFKLGYRLTREISQRDAEPRPRVAKRSRAKRSSGVPRVNGRVADSGRSGQQDQSDDDGSGPGNNGKEREPFELKADITDKEVKRVMKIQENATPELLKKEGVVGTATGVNVDGDLVVRVYTARHGIDKTIPRTIEGIPVEAKVVGRIRASYQPPQDKRGRAGIRPGGSQAGGLTPTSPAPERPEVDDPQDFFPRPIPIGVSGINQSLFGCGTGTIGSRLRGADGTLYALSNNHVFADENTAPIGDPILQPGPLDNDCRVDPSHSVGTLAAFIPISFGLIFGAGDNRIDAAVAHVTAATVSNRTPRGAYGLPNTSTLPARLGMKVQKMGRTTMFTTGRVTALNSIIPVLYANGIAVFSGQIEITKPIFIIDEVTGTITIVLEEFSAGGDSGSLVVTTYGNNPVGLLFAGSVFFTFANPIDEVLQAVGEELGQTVTIDGAPSNIAQ